MKRLVIDARESGTGTGRYIDKLIEYLHKLSPPFDVLVLTKQHRLGFIAKIAPGFTAVESNYPEFGFAEQLGLWRQIRRLKPDLVHFGMTQQPVLYKDLVVTTMHDLTTTRFRNPQKNWLSFTFKQWVYRWVAKRVAKKSSFVITPSNFVKQAVADYAHISKDKIVVTYEATEKILVKPQSVKGLKPQKYLMYLGRPQAHKNLKRLVKAYAQLKTSHPDIKLVLAGKKEPLHLELIKWAEKNQIDGLMLTDFVSDGQLRWLYENAAVYVFPSLSEGFGLPGLEAMAHGAPVVSSNATCLPEIYGDGALYFDPLDVGDMASKISLALSDAKLRESLIKKGYAQAAKYSWQRMATQTLDVYKKALG